jgi:hypothetical protein
LHDPNIFGMVKIVSGVFLNVSAYRRVKTVTTFVEGKDGDGDDDDNEDGDRNFDRQRFGLLTNWDFENKQN